MCARLAPPLGLVGPLLIQEFASHQQLCCNQPASLVMRVYRLALLSVLVFLTSIATTRALWKPKLPLERLLSKAHLRIFNDEVAKIRAANNEKLAKKIENEKNIVTRFIIKLSYARFFKKTRKILLYLLCEKFEKLRKKGVSPFHVHAMLYLHKAKETGVVYQAYGKYSDYCAEAYRKELQART